MRGCYGLTTPVGTSSGTGLHPSSTIRAGTPVGARMKRPTEPGKVTVAITGRQDAVLMNVL